MKRIEEYTVGELARASGVSVRTLHYYDALRLLSPARVAQNRYRLYRRTEALRL
ncbi:MAG TPA: MerR family transcriptional regulator, partial [Rhodobacteraceae bacterium]|nr:MerR family transcriptional regulator [Paracoccaceae bacterium]